jgi:hypothetical protein
MNFKNDSKTSNILLENLGGKSVYNILKEKENFEPNSCAINKIDISVDKIVSTESTYHSINTKFYIMSLSIIGIYVFSRILIKSQSLK